MTKDLSSPNELQWPFGNFPSWQARDPEWQELQATLQQLASMNKLSQMVFQQYQAGQQELTQVIEQASEVLFDRTEEAHRLLREGCERNDEFEKTTVAWLNQQQELLSCQEKLLSLQHKHMAREVAESRANLLWNLATAAYLMGRSKEAHDAAEDAMSHLGDWLSPTRPALQHALGDIYEQQGEFRQALACYEQAFREFLKLELWNKATHSLMRAADCMLEQGHRRSSQERLGEAIRLAEEHQLSELERQLRVKEFGFRLRADGLGDAWQAAKKRQGIGMHGAALQRDANLLSARNWARLGVLRRAQQCFEKIRNRADSDAALWSMTVEWSDVCVEAGQGAEAVKSLQQALDIARGGLPELRALTLAKLVPLRLLLGDADSADRDLDELISLGSNFSLVLALLIRGQVYYQQKQFNLALADLERAAGSGPTSEQQRMIFLARGATLHALGRRSDELDANLEAIRLSEDELDQASRAEWLDRLNQFASLCGNSALLLAESGRTREALDYAEKGRAQSLTQMLSQDESAVFSGGRNELSDQDELRSWLGNESAALILFVLGSDHTLALVVDPERPDPEAIFVDLGRRDLKQLFHMSFLSPDEWNARLFDALPTLSEKFRSVWHVLTDHSRVLYILPDAELYSVPFAALTFEDGSPIVSRFALAYAPSIAWLNRCRSLRPASQGEPIQAAHSVGVGT